MNAVVVNFESLQQEHNKKIQAKKEQLIFECKRDIINAEEHIKMLAQQIQELQTNIDLNYRLIAKINLQ